MLLVDRWAFLRNKCFYVAFKNDCLEIDFLTELYFDVTFIYIDYTISKRVTFLEVKVI